MATQTSKRSTTVRKPRPNILRTFTKWLEVKDAAGELGEQQTELRLEMVNILNELGEKDDKGNLWIDLPEPLAFKDHDVIGRVGKTHVFTTLKLERHLTPANPGPDAQKSTALLKEKRLWLTKAQIKVIEEIQASCPYVTISVSIDPDAVAKAYFQNRLTEEEYDSILVEQKESFQFRPSEA